MHRSLALALALIAPATLQAAAAPPTPTLEFAFAETVTLAPGVAAGQTPYGERTMIPITGGTFEGPAIRGTVVPGGWDWQLRRADGCTGVKADYFLKTDDGVMINVVNTGTLCPPRPGQPAARTLPVFEAPIGKYDWLSRSAFVGTLEPARAPDGGPAVLIRFYRVR